MSFDFLLPNEDTITAEEGIDGPLYSPNIFVPCTFFLLYNLAPLLSSSCLICSNLSPPAR